MRHLDEPLSSLDARRALSTIGAALGDIIEATIDSCARVVPAHDGDLPGNCSSVRDVLIFAMWTWR